MKSPSSTSNSSTRTAAVVTAKLLVLAAVTLPLQMLFQWYSGPPRVSLITGALSVTGADEVMSYSGRVTLARMHALAAERPSILYLGDSTTLDLVTGIRPTTPEFMQEEVPECRIGSVVHGGFNLDTFRALYEHQLHLTDSIEVVVVPLNVRAFGKKWQYNPQFRFEFLERMLRMDSAGLTPFYRPLRVFGVLEHFQAPAEPWVALESAYEFTVEPDNPGFEWLEELQALTESNECELFVYLTPTQFTYLRNQNGPETEAVVRRNIETIREFAESRSIHTLDLTDAVSDEHFYILQGTVDHLFDSGRIQVAQAIAAELRRLELAECVQE